MTANTYIDLDPSKLVLSVQYQARKTPGQMPLTELAASIAAVGLLQNLVVIKGKKKGIYEVIAGGRRIQAIEILITNGRWPDGQTVQCKLVDKNIALDASITENVHREKMHPADEFEAFAKLIVQGKTLEGVAATFGVGANFVKRRLRMSAVAPELISAYRANEMTLEMLMAFTVSDDQKRQCEVWAALQGWQRTNPGSVRALLTDETMTADHRLIQCISVETYEAAGGHVFRDLFAQDDDLEGIYIQDKDLVEQLALEKLTTHVAPLLETGWGWVELRLEKDYAEWEKHGRIYAVSRELTKEEAESIAGFERHQDKLSDEMNNLRDSDDEGSEEKYYQLESEHEAMEHQITLVKQDTKQWPAELLSLAGCVVSIQHNGAVQIDYGLVRPEDRAGVAQAAAAIQNETGISLSTSLPQPVTRPVHSERLVRQLTANKVGIVQAFVANQHHIALAVLVAQLAQDEFAPIYSRSGFGLGIRRDCENITAAAPDFETSKAYRELQSIRLHWLDQLPKNENGDVNGLLGWAVDQDQETLIELLAFLVAGSVQGIQHTESKHVSKLDELAIITGVPMADWWTPTADSYLSHVPKDRIIDVVATGASKEDAAPLAKMKKAEAVKAAEAALAGKNWLPEIMRIAQPEVNQTA